MTTAGAVFSKMKLTGEILCRSGLRVGTSTDVMEIGGVDMPVIRDPVTQEPYIPGSSFRGKLRSLMEKRTFSLLIDRNPQQAGDNFFNVNLAPGNAPKVRHHECKGEECPPCRIFGVTRKWAGINRPGRLVVRDCRLLNKEELRTAGALYTEIKYENSLDRITAAASPRQVERVPRGARFSLQLVYTVEDRKKAVEDLAELIGCLKLLEDDYLGGGGSRGSGEIEFENLVLHKRDLAYYEGKGPEKTESLSLESSDEEIQKILTGLLEG